MRTTYFGVQVHTRGRLQCVRLDDLKHLPFFDFWEASARGSTCLVDDDGQKWGYLHDFEAFSRLFIKTGKHRFQK